MKEREKSEKNGQGEQAKPQSKLPFRRKRESIDAALGADTLSLSPASLFLFSLFL